MYKILRDNIKKWLILIIVFQMSILAWEYVGARYPVWTGTEISLKTVPYDPRDMFRGNYARLNYDITLIPMEKITNKPRKIRNGEIIYVNLEKKGSVYEFHSASFQKPLSGIFLRGRIEDKYISSEDKNCTVKYGIEAFFAKKEKALALEKDLRAGNGIAIVKVTSNGKAALIDVHKNEL